MPDYQTVLKVTDMHTAGEPVRIVTGGYPQLAGETILLKRRDALEHHDALRDLLMLEPRGHPEMYGVIPVQPDLPDAALGVLFTHNSGYSTMCGHATIAIGRWAVESGIVPAREPVTEFTLQCPCGPVRVRSEVADGRVGDVSFENVPGYVPAMAVPIAVEGVGEVAVDLIYGGAYYACVPAAALGLDLRADPLDVVRERALAVTAFLRDNHSIAHPTEGDLGFLYGTIVTEGDRVAPGQTNYHLCYFGEGQLDRSPTGSGVTARLALAYQRGEVGIGEQCRFAGLSGIAFTGEVSARADLAGEAAVITSVSGRANYSGYSEFVLEHDDLLPGGLAVPQKVGDIWG